MLSGYVRQFLCSGLSVTTFLAAAHRKFVNKRPHLYVLEPPIGDMDTFEENSGFISTQVIHKGVRAFFKASFLRRLCQIPLLKRRLCRIPLLKRAGERLRQL
eukprot:TRINITY_DN14925_c1_g1_i1.p1 TRINITY_DN14925_c1_g1~~TRINITY_DN14925_c1_g1_i1.p1  ORF type:complete len:102 (+),score=8.34 TRINITY_DN14925_c1_g1_i1:236-541(+)